MSTVAAVTLAAIVAGQRRPDPVTGLPRFMIGLGASKLPWGRLLTEDMKHFRETTSRVADPAKVNVVVMGYKTWKSIPAKFRILHGVDSPRVTLVVADRAPSEADFKQAEESGGWLNFTSMRQLTVEGLAEACHETNPAEVETIFFAGGVAVYEHALRELKVPTLYLTDVSSGVDFEADVSIDATMFDTYSLPEGLVAVRHEAVEPMSGKSVVYQIEHRSLV